ncbi:uncharacterized protein LOC116722931 [Xiphophorus hellerii]|uniref:uncharacterized protein LOC116722931 n=1 Tax=Xiphophorus hellerii TaxID=8084 RepID=UPI0013B35822|nr:uncharacterized protein LOC116722931 [Xiphophorus hellerii]
MWDFLMRRLRGLRGTLMQAGTKLFFSLQVKIRVVISGQTFGAHHELLDQLERKLKLVHTDRDRNSITILFCPITSRVGSDVEAAMSSLSGDQKVILVLMHHTRDPSYSTAGTDWADVYPNVVSSVHVFFHESVPGLLTCFQNNMAVDQMLRVLSSYSITIGKSNTVIRSPMFWGGVAITCVVLLLFYYKRSAPLPPSTEKPPV